MGRVQELLVTQIYREELQHGATSALVSELLGAVHEIADAGWAGQGWSKANNCLDIHLMLRSMIPRHRHPASSNLVAVLDRNVSSFGRVLEFDLEVRRLALDSLWINVLKPGGPHSAHIHPHSVISGTLYLAVPKDASAIKYEDPRLPMLMAAPPRKPSAKDKNKTFVSAAPQPGTLLLWESWLRHEVPVNHAKVEWLSVNFNYRLD